MAKLTPLRRDEILVEMYGTIQRLDERTESQEKHLEKINGSGAKRDMRLARLEITLASLIALLIGLGIIDASMTHVLIGG